MSQLRTALLLSTILITKLTNAHTVERAIEHYEQHAYSKAKQAFQQVTQSSISEQPEIQQAHIYLSRIWLKEQNTDKAKEHIDYAISISPNSAGEWVLAGDVYCAHAMEVSIFKALKFGKSCINYFENAVKADPNHIVGMGRLIEFYLYTPGVAGGSIKKAKHYLSKLYEVSPEAARFYEVQLFAEEKDTEAAVALAKRYASLDIKESEYLYNLALYLKREGELSTAEPLFAKIIGKTQSIAPSSSWHTKDSLLQLGEIHLAQNRIKDAIRALEHYLKSNSDIYDRHFYWARWSMAQAYYSNNQCEEYEAIVSKLKQMPYSRDKAFQKSFEKGIADRKKRKTPCIS